MSPLHWDSDWTPAERQTAHAQRSIPRPLPISDHAWTDHALRLQNLEREIRDAVNAWDLAGPHDEGRDRELVDRLEALLERPQY